MYSNIPQNHDQPNPVPNITWTYLYQPAGFEPRPPYRRWSLPRLSLWYFRGHPETAGQETAPAPGTTGVEPTGCLSWFITINARRLQGMLSVYNYCIKLCGCCCIILIFCQRIALGQLVRWVAWGMSGKTSLGSWCMVYPVTISFFTMFHICLIDLLVLDFFHPKLLKPPAKYLDLLKEPQKYKTYSL